MLKGACYSLTEDSFTGQNTLYRTTFKIGLVLKRAKPTITLPLCHYMH